MDSLFKCEVRVQGRLSTMWLEWIDGITLTNPTGSETILAVELADQTILLGLLNRLHALNVHILSVSYKGNDSATLTE
jgi:hypothetical protein